MKTDSENKRQYILDVASGIFAKFGFAKTTLDDIADAVGMKKGSLYYYFDSKEAIFSAVIHEVAEDIFAKMKKATLSAKSARDALLIFIETGMKASREATNLIGVTAQVKKELLPIADQILKEFYEDLVQYTSRLIDRGVETGEFKPNDSNRVSRALYLVIDGIEAKLLYTHASFTDPSYDLQPIIDEILYVVVLILDGLKPCPPSQTTSS